MKNILLLRVGIDLGCGGTLGPIFPDGTFEYVPIPESCEPCCRTVYYRDLPARHGGTLAQYVPKRYRDLGAHYDPEFETFTYGDPTPIKRSQLLRLVDSDLIVFYAGLRSIEPGTKGKLYIIGYFTVSSVHEIKSANEWPPLDTPHLLKNAHLRRPRADKGLVIVCGRSGSSKLLDRAILISDKTQLATSEAKKKLGISGSLKRAVGRWVPNQNISTAKKWILRHQL